jgi:hypothetical protein
MDEELLNNMNVDNVEESANSTESTAVEPSEEAGIVADNSPSEASNEVENDNVNSNIGKTNNTHQYTDLEKAQYSFHKQFARQNAKHKQEIANLKAEFDKRLAEEIDKVKNPAKYAPKTRKDFEYDDDYVKYLADERVNEALEAKINEYKKQQEEAQRQAEVDAEYRTMLDKSVKSIYNTPEAEADWREKVGTGMKAGLGKLIDSDADLSNYIIFSPIGPKIMYELATNKNATKDIFTIGMTPDGQAIMRSPSDRMRKIEELAERLSRTDVNRTDVNNNKRNVQPVKPIGKPGINKEVKKDIFSDPKALLDMMYK